MERGFFKNCTSLDEVKKMYKNLALKHHPDRGGCTATMQQINAEYENIMKNPFFSFSDQSEQEQEEFIKYPEIINQIIGFHGILIELIGNWIWLSGNTYPYRNELKKIGFCFAPKKVMWFYRSADYKSRNKSPISIENIRAKYGSDKIENKTERFVLRN